MKNKKIRVGILGLTFLSGNKGCEALSYSFMSILQSIAFKRNIELDVVLFQNVGIKRAIASFTGQWALKKMYPKEDYRNLNFKIVPLDKNAFSAVINMNMKKCDVIFEFTAGDSFTDIYGVERAKRKMHYTKMVLKNKVPLIMGSQTIGPFSEGEIRNIATYILDNSLKIYTRDELSYECVRSVSNNNPELTCDMAFVLPYKDNEDDSSIYKIGINVSGLLWSGGYTGNNQFGLSIDYQKYCEQVLEYFDNRNDCDIYFIPHATTTANQGVYTKDDDNCMIEELRKKFPRLIVENEFKTPMEAKSKIAGMDFFIGARMHATIAAISSGVVTVPISYSRKFEGLYNGIEYPYLISGTKDETDNAVKKTIQWFENRQQIKSNVDRSREIAAKQLEVFIKGVEEIIVGINRE